MSRRLGTEAIPRLSPGSCSLSLVLEQEQKIMLDRMINKTSM